MALVECGECGEEVSDKASKCPKCGIDNPVRVAEAKSNKLKRKGGCLSKINIIEIIIIGLLVIFFSNIHSKEERLLSKLKNPAGLSVIEISNAYNELYAINPRNNEYEAKSIEYSKKSKEARKKKLLTETISILMKIKNVKESNYDKKIELYKQLVDLHPGDKGYKENIAYYSKKKKSEYDFGETKWGMSKATEQSSTKEKLNKEVAETLMLKKVEYRKKWIEEQAKIKSKPDDSKSELVLSWGMKVYRKIKENWNRAQFQTVNNDWKGVIKITISLEGQIDKEIIVKSCTGTADFCKAYFIENKSNAAIFNICKPAVVRWQQRYKQAIIAFKEAKEMFERSKKTDDAVLIANTEKSFKECKEEKDALEIFKKDLGTFVRYYEFMSQIVDYDDKDLEKLSLYARNLRPSLREKQLDEDDIDLDNVVLSRYRLSKIRQQDLQLKKTNVDGLKPGDGLGSGKPKDKKEERLSLIITRLNELFVTDKLTDKDVVNYAHAIRDKVSENDVVMDQISNNSPDQAMKGDFPSAIADAVMDSSEAHQNIMLQLLNDEKKMAAFGKVVFDLIQSSKRA